jgi:hypothetical protein
MPRLANLRRRNKLLRVADLHRLLDALDPVE